MNSIKNIPLFEINLTVYASDKALCELQSYIYNQFSTIL